MKINKIKIKNILGISEAELTNKDYEITGESGLGKTSIIDAVRYALRNDTNRDVIVKKGETEGEIYLETDTGLTVLRKPRTDKAQYVSVKENGDTISSPETYLRTIFTPLQLDPVGFTRLSKDEQNRVILDLIEFKWDINWIKEQFGEIPTGVDYSKHILEVLEQIQSEKGDYYLKRQDINRDIRNNKDHISKIAESLPPNYNFEKWSNYNIVDKVTELEKYRKYNATIERAKQFKDSYENKIKGYQAELEIDKSSAEQLIAQERSSLETTVARLQAELKAAQDKLLTLNEKLADKVKLAEQAYETKVSKLDGDMSVAKEYATKEIVDITNLNEEVNQAQQMIKYVNEYKRMTDYEKENEKLTADSENLTNKIELARTLPGTILANCELPIKDLTIENGKPLVRGLPICNLSDGEKLQLCIDVTCAKTGNLKIILLDGMEKLDSTSRQALYDSCKAKGLQFIATRVTDSDELLITEL